MRVRRRGAAGAFAAALFLASCSAATPRRPLTPGYYLLDASDYGIAARIVVTGGDRRLSYDVWRVSSDGSSVKHGHYDLIAADDVPSSGEFSITQDGSDCGTLTIAPAGPAERFAPEGFLRVAYGLISRTYTFHSLPAADADRYKMYDDAVSRRMLNAGSQSDVYDDLNPNCTYD